MWMFLGLLMICLTIIVLFRMYIDLRRITNQHNRMVQSDHRNHQRYIEVTSGHQPRALPQASMPDFEQALFKAQAQARYKAALIEQAQRQLPAVRYWKENEKPLPSLDDWERYNSPHMVPYKKAKLDPRLLNNDQIEYLIKHKYGQWMNEQRRKYG